MEPVQVSANACADLMIDALIHGRVGFQQSGDGGKARCSNITQALWPSNTDEFTRSFPRVGCLVGVTLPTRVAALHYMKSVTSMPDDLFERDVYSALFTIQVLQDRLMDMQLKPSSVIAIAAIISSMISATGREDFILPLVNCMSDPRNHRETVIRSRGFHGSKAYEDWCRHIKSLRQDVLHAWKESGRAIGYGVISQGEQIFAHGFNEPPTDAPPSCILPNDTLIMPAMTSDAVQLTWLDYLKSK